jgi:membrane protein YqaA with SNARE-associated domain
MEFLTGMPVWVSAFVGCAIGSVIPIIHTELLVFGIVTLSPGKHGIPLVLIATAGTMVGKTVLFYAGRGLLKLKLRNREKIDQFVASAQKRQGVAGTVLFASAASGFPPFYVVTVASGILKLSLVTFLTFGFIGRFLRFMAVVYAPQIVKGLTP